METTRRRKKEVPTPSLSSPSSPTPNRVNVTLRWKPLKDGTLSGYLDYFPAIPNPKKAGQYTRREFLGIYLLPSDQPKVRGAKLTRAMELEQARQRAYGTDKLKQERTKAEMRHSTTLADWMRHYADRNDELEEKTKDAWRQSAGMFEHFLEAKGIHPSETTFAQLTTELLRDYRRFLTTEAKDRRVLRSRGLSPLSPDAKNVRPLGRTAAAGYLNTLLAALKRAHTGRRGGDENLLEMPIHASIEPIKGESEEPNPLTIAEVRRLMEAPMEDEVLRRAALFSAMVGLRSSDLANLKWAQVEVRSDGVWVHKKVKKTNRTEYYPVPPDAVPYMSPGAAWVPVLPMPQEGNENATVYGETHMPPDAPVFAGFKPYTESDRAPKLRVWIARAGITRPGMDTFSFHDLRHTFAVTHIENGLDIYRLSKLLGHKSINTTAKVYAKWLDKQRRQQVERINYSR